MAWVGPHGDVDRYELVELRSSGGEGQLWRGSLSVDGVEISVAVKVIHPSRNADLEEWRQRWQRQAELLRTLDHPGLVKVRDVFEGPMPHERGVADHETNTLFLVMNWVEGPSLDEWVARNPSRDLLESARVLGKLAAAVDYLHSGAVTGSPVLHRDIKPANVIVSERGAVLVDFGFTRVLSDQPMSMVGTPAFIAPEVLASNDHSPASDRYSLGATGYYAITGELPTPSNLAAMRAALTAAAGAEGRDDIADHVLSMMDPEPARRPTGAVPWAQQLAAAAVSDTTLTVRRQVSPLPPPPPTALASVPPPPTSASVGRPAQAPGRRRNRTPLIVAGTAVVLLGVAGGAVVALSGSDDDPDSMASPETTSSEEVPSGSPSSAAEDVTTTDAAGTTTTAVPTTAAIALVAVPAVEGKALEQAQRLLEMASLSFEVVEIEGPGPYGRVTSANPAAKTRVEPGSAVTLTVAKQPAVMPSVVGTTADDAQSTLEAYGIAATQVEVLAEGSPDGTVIDQTPKPGEPFAASASLTVSRKAAVAYLSDLEPVDGSYSNRQVGQAQLNGTIYTRSVVIDPYSGQPAFDEYDLARKYLRLTGTVGPRDDIDSASIFKIEIFADGVPVFDQTLGLGQAAPVDLDMTNVLRVRLQVTDLSSDYQYDYVVFADTRILGLPSVVPSTTG